MFPFICTKRYWIMILRGDIISPFQSKSDLRQDGKNVSMTFRGRDSEWYQKCILTDRDPINLSFSERSCAHMHTHTCSKACTHIYTQAHNKEKWPRVSVRTRKVWGDKEGRGKWCNYALKNIKKEFSNHKFLKHV